MTLDVLVTLDNGNTRTEYHGTDPQRAVDIASLWRNVEGVHRVNIARTVNGKTAVFCAS